MTDYDTDDGLPTSILGSLVWLAALAVMLAAWAVLATASTLRHAVAIR